MSVELDLREFDEWEKQLLEYANDNLKRETRSYLNKAGTKLKKATLKEAKSKVKSKGDKSGYLKSIKRGKVYKYNGDAYAIRAYSGHPIAHLLEKGHKLVRNGKEYGWVDGYHIFESAQNNFDEVYFSETEKFLEKILEQMGK